MRATLLILLAVGAHAQSTPTFEVASVKVSPPRRGTDRYTTMDTDPAMVRYSNITLSNLIAIAYRYDSNLIVIPERFGGGSYDVAARLPAAASKDKVPEMMQTLLAERFKLVVHRESRDEKVYYLTIARNGPKLKPARPEGGPNSITLNGIFGRAMPISMLAASLTRPLEGTRVIDKTGLEGNFDIELRYVPPNSKEPGPDVVAALQEQLGLKLAAGKSPIERIIVDHAEKIPTEN
jgi:uncharacterized protein (TIGR03435 family)